MYKFNRMYQQLFIFNYSTKITLLYICLILNSSLLCNAYNASSGRRISNDKNDKNLASARRGLAPISSIEDVPRKDPPQAMSRTKFLSQTLVANSDAAVQPQSPATNEQPFASILYTAVLRGKVALPCDVTPPTTDDSVALILWYKDDALAPIYTLDARKGTLEQARTITAASLEGRAYFNLHNRPAFLQIDPIRIEDAGDYRCRVDYKKSRSVNTVINLKVIVPPETPQITTMDGKILKELVGPFNEGDSLQLMCTTNGGKPKPSLTWFGGEYTLLDDSFEYNNKDVTSNQLTIESLARHHLLSVIICQAINNNITVPSSASITLDLNLKPTEVHIKQITPILVSEKEAKFECTTLGSRPRAVLYWMFDGKRLNSQLNGDHQTTTTITLKMKQIHNGVSLFCFAENPKIANSSISDELILDVQFAPILNLQLGASTLSLQTLQEGQDIYFDCHINANPRSNQALIWRFNDHLLKPSPGIIQSNQSLVLQKVNRKQSGVYKCEVSNNQGTTLSNPISLNIRYAPVCRSSFIYVYGVSTFETVHLQCDVDANPPQVSFNWKLQSNSFLETFQQINDTSAILKYSPQTAQHFGTIQCTAKNDVGLQQTPCLFQIITAGLPVFPYDCSASNQSDTSLMITCEHTSNSNNNLDQNLFNEDDLNGDLMINNEDNLISNNSILHNSNEIPGLNQQRHSSSSKQQYSSHSHNSIINHIDLKPKSPTSLFIYPNLIYVCEVFKGNRLVRNITTTLNKRNNSIPFLHDINGNIEFIINGLQPASMYQLKIYAKNSKGNSRHIQLKAETLRPAERFIDGSFNLDSVFASDSISGNEGYGQLSSNSDDTNALTNDINANVDLQDTNSNVLNSELLSGVRNARSMFGFTSGKPMLLALLSGIMLVSLIIVALGVAFILRVKRVQGCMNPNTTTSNGSSIGGRNSNSNSQSINETSTNTVNTSCSTGELLSGGKNQVISHSNKSNNSSPANHQYQIGNNLIHNSTLNQNSTLSRQSQNQLLKRQSLTNNALLIHSSPQKLLQTNCGTTNLISNTSTGILTTALPGIVDDCCCEDDYCEELRMVSNVISEQQQQRALIAQHQLDHQQQLYQSLINSGKAPDLIPSYGFNNYENTNKQFIAYDYPGNVIQAANNMNTINNLAKFNLLQDANLHYAELQFQPHHLNQFIAEQQIMANSNYDQLNDESGFEEFNSGSVVDGDNSYNDNNPYTLKTSLSNNDILAQQQIQLQNHVNKSKQQNIGIETGFEYAKLDFCSELLKKQVLNSQSSNSPSILSSSKQSRVNIVSTNQTTTDNLSSDQQSLNQNKFESTV